jgi:Bacterial regulatory helix-turn-helix protein, lysR family
MANLPLNWESRIGRRLKFRDLHILFTVVQWGSMAKGAVHLGMSQPAVSEAIASLEDALRVRLLDRSPRGIEPTIYGRGRGTDRLPGITSGWVRARDRRPTLSAIPESIRAYGCRPNGRTGISGIARAQRRSAVGEAIQTSV